MKAKITINISDAIGDIDPRIYGSFIEHLGRAVYHDRDRRQTVGPDHLLSVPSLFGERTRKGSEYCLRMRQI